MSHRKLWVGLLVTLGLVACSDDEAPAGPGGAGGAGGGEAVSEVDQLLAKARAATERYADVAVAEADGFVAMGKCEETPAGGMGIHYVNRQRLGAPLAVEAPAALLYEPNERGVALVAIEYLQLILQDGQPYVADEDHPPRAESIPATPELFPGHPFQGPMAGHTPEMPWHFDFHVWLYRENPRGTFAEWNPTVHCPE